MRSLTFAVPFALMLAACGGGGSTNPIPDAPNQTVHDAPVSNPGVDAANGNPAAMGLGKVCNQTQMCPTTGATLCVALSMSATQGFCTLGCGTTTKPASGNPTPPPGGDAMCTASTPAPGAGTPACVLATAPDANNMIKWDCAILCGMQGTTNLGTCPGGLTCTMNICQ